MCRSLTDASELQAKVEEAVDSLSKSYVEAVKTLNVLKDRINQLEQARADGNSIENHALGRELDSAVERFDAFVDSWILDSRDAWIKYRRLEKESLTVKEPNLDRLNALRSLCQQSEQLAKDLLCYSLARLKRVRSP